VRARVLGRCPTPATTSKGPLWWIDARRWLIESTQKHPSRKGVMTILGNKCKLRVLASVIDCD